MPEEYPVVTAVNSLNSKVNGGELIINNIEWEDGYYYNASLVAVAYSSPSGFRIAKVDVSEYRNQKIKLECYSMSSAWSGFTDEEDSVISTWHQNSREEKVVPENAKWLYISDFTPQSHFYLSCVFNNLLNRVSALEGLPKKCDNLSTRVSLLESTADVSGYEEYDSNKSYRIGDIVLYNEVLKHCIENTTGAFDNSKWEDTSVRREFELRDYIYPTTKLTGLSWDARGDSITAGSNGSSYVPLQEVPKSDVYFRLQEHPST